MGWSEIGNPFSRSYGFYPGRMSSEVVWDVVGVVFLGESVVTECLVVQAWWRYVIHASGTVPVGVSISVSVDAYDLELSSDAVAVVGTVSTSGRDPSRVIAGCVGMPF